MEDKSRKPSPRQEPVAIGETELRVMNSRGRELLLKYWDFPLFASALRKHSISLSSARVLDAGCGSGFSLTLIWERFRPAELAAFDIVPAQVERARARGTPASIFTADITALEIPSRSFDAVFVCGVLHHCRQWRTGLAEVTRVLKNGGVLLLEEPASAHLRFEQLLIGQSPALEAGFSLQSLRNEMTRNGLGILEQRSLYFGLFGSYLCVKGVGAADNSYYVARHLVRAPSEDALAAGQQVPA